MKNVNKTTGEIKRIKPQLSQQQHKTHISTPSLTHQSHAESCDVKKIIKQYSRTGELPPNPRGLQPQYADVSNLNRPFGELIDEAREAEETLGEINQQMEKQAKVKKDKELAEYQKYLDEKNKTNPEPTPDIKTE